MGSVLTPFSKKILNSSIGYVNTVLLIMESGISREYSLRIEHNSHFDRIILNNIARVINYFQQRKGKLISQGS